MARSKKKGTQAPAVRVITTAEVEKLARLAAVIRLNPQWHLKYPVERLEHVLAELRKFDHGLAFVEFEQPTPGTPLWRPKDLTLPSYVANGTHDQKLLGYRFYRDLLQPLQVAVYQTILARTTETTLSEWAL
jgi:hypothetical protein